VVVILLLNLKVFETTYGLLVAIEIPSCRVISYRLKRSVPLNDVIEILDRDLYPKAPKRTPASFKGAPARSNQKLHEQVN